MWLEDPTGCAGVLLRRAFMDWHGRNSRFRSSRVSLEAASRREPSCIACSNN